MIEVHATGLALFVGMTALAVTGRTPLWLVPFLTANSVVGSIYMHLERRPLRERGTSMFGFSYKVTPVLNVVINIVTHFAVPALLLAHVAFAEQALTREALALIALAEVFGLVVIDLASSYPTRKGIAPYAISHVGMVSVTALGLHTTRA